MSITQVTPTAVAPPTAPTQAPTQQAPASGAANPPAPTGTNGAQNSSAAASTPAAKPDNDAVKVSLSDAAAKLLAANKKVNADGTVGPHHKPRHPKV